VRRAREEAERLGLLDEQARALNAGARLLLRLGDFRGATAQANEALRLASLQGDLPRERASALETLGRVEVAGGELDRGEQLLYEAQAMQRAQSDASGVLRTTLAVLEIFVRRGDPALFEATLEGLGETGRLERARVLMLRAWAACGDETPPTTCLGDLERAAAVADSYRDLELAWRIALTRGRLLVALGETESALAAYVEAMSAIRDLVQRVPEAQRDGYVQQADCVACKEEFKRLRQGGGR
jgi:tetratricopeptide (TPR) repeat protein